MSLSRRAKKGIRAFAREQARKPQYLMSQKTLDSYAVAYQNDTKRYVKAYQSVKGQTNDQTSG